MELEPPDLLNCPDPHLNKSSEDADPDGSIHAFNNSTISNCTVIETNCGAKRKNNSCEGSDSGVEVFETPDIRIERAMSTNSATSSQDFDTITPAPSVDSSIISCCSNYDDAYNLLVRRNSTLIEDYKIKHGDGTSDNGSESSSVKSTKISKRKTLDLKKKVSVIDGKVIRGSIKPAVTARSLPTNITKSRCMSTDRNAIDNQQKSSSNRNVCTTTRSSNQSRTKPTPDNLTLSCSPTNGTGLTRGGNVRRSLVRGSSTTRTPSVPTPTDDGRWPSVNSKPAPLMTRSFRGMLTAEAVIPPPKTVRVTNLQTETKNTLEKYATLPRRRKERSTENLATKASSRESSVTRTLTLRRQTSRENTPSRPLLPFPKKRTKTRIFHETSVQTALTQLDIANALAGVGCAPTDPYDVETANVGVQADRRIEEMDTLQEQLRHMTEKYARLHEDHAEQKEALENAERLLRDERLEKEGLQMELKKNSERVFAILGCDNNETQEESDSLLVLETKLINEKQLLLKQEQEISDLHIYCRTLQKNLDKSMTSQENLLQHAHEQKLESEELHDFLQAEKTTLTDALKESENEISRLKDCCEHQDKELETKETEYKHLFKISEHRRQDNLCLQAKLIALEAKCRELLVHQGSAVSGAAVALTALVSRLEGLIEELISSYNISEQELDDVIFHNEAYSNSSSSPDTTPDTSKKFVAVKAPASPKPASSFVAAVINAIKNAAAQSPFAANRDLSKDEVTDNSDSTELLDSETEPCLMMEHVLEDVIIPDTHSHNMISSNSNRSMFSSARLTHSESLQAIPTSPATNRGQIASSLAHTNTVSVSLLDQVIYVDNLVTKLLKVIRIIQMESEAYTNELLDERDSYAEQGNSQKETNRIVVKQLRDWEILGAQLKSEVEQLMQQLSKKNGDIDDMRTELNHQRTEIEKLNKDVCDLSTALSKAEDNYKIMDDDVSDAIIEFKNSIEAPSKEAVCRLIKSLEEIPSLKDKLLQKDKQLNELAQEFSANRQVLTDNLKEAVTEAKKQYNAIDNALETLHGIQSVVHQCPPLAKLQRDLEEVSFQSASEMPLVVPGDYNANANGLIQAVANIEIASPINTSA